MSESHNGKSPAWRYAGCWLYGVQRVEGGSSQLLMQTRSCIAVINTATTTGHQLPFDVRR